jgi:hypothetical protein
VPARAAVRRQVLDRGEQWRYCSHKIARPSIILACRDSAERTVLGRELSKRYGADYHVVVCDQPGRSGSDFEAVRVIGERWSVRSQELRDIFSRNGIPAGFYDAASTAGRQMLRELSVAPSDLPVLMLLFGGRQATLVNPSNAEIADAFAVMPPIPPPRYSTWPSSAPARQAWPLRCMRHRKACGRWSWNAKPSAVRRGPVR